MNTKQKTTETAAGSQNVRKGSTDAIIARAYGFRPISEWKPQYPDLVTGKTAWGMDYDIADTGEAK